MTKVSSDKDESVVEFLSCEHAALQSARLKSVIDRNGRLQDYLSAVSAGVIALAFIGQTSKFGMAFYLFGITLLLALAILGVFTFLRTLQIRIEDSDLALAINRIRHYYVETAPHARHYLLMPYTDTMDDLLSVGVHSSRLAPMLGVAGSVAFVNSFLLGAAAALGARAAFEAPTSVSAGAGPAVFVVSLVIHHLYQRRRWRATHASYVPACADPIPESSPN